MLQAKDLHPEFVTDRDGNRKSVILPIGEFVELLDDLADLAAVSERRDEPTLSHGELLEELRRDGLLPD
jgi:hypothetical protein